MATIHPTGGRRPSKLTAGRAKAQSNTNTSGNDDSVHEEEHACENVNFISGVSSSNGGKEYQEDMAVKIDDFNAVIRRENKKTQPFAGDLDTPRAFYAIYDGHGGARCSKFLAENFHVMLAKHELLGEQPEEALNQVWAHAEERFLEVCSKKFAKAKSEGQGMAFHRSGSTATVLLIVGDTIYAANCGDSHMYLYSTGKHPKRLSDDHNTDNPAECTRIRKTGAKVEQETITVKTGCFSTSMVSVGKLRVWPGGLAVTRSFGDYAAKLEALGGVADSILSEYEDLRKLQMGKKWEGIILASDGVWDALKAAKVWEVFIGKYKQTSAALGEDERIADSIQSVVEAAVSSRFWEDVQCTADNATAIVVKFTSGSEDGEVQPATEDHGDGAADELPMQQQSTADGESDEQGEEGGARRRARVGTDELSRKSGKTDESPVKGRKGRRRYVPSEKKSVTFADLD